MPSQRYFDSFYSFFLLPVLLKIHHPNWILSVTIKIHYIKMENSCVDRDTFNMFLVCHSYHITSQMLWTNCLILFCASVAAKSGVDPSGCVGLARHVKMSCPNLEFSGLMTIGMLDYSSTPENFRVSDLSRMISWLSVCLS